MADSSMHGKCGTLDISIWRGVLDAIFGGKGVTMAMFREETVAYL